MTRPLPQPDDATAPYWEAARRGELRMQRCADCQTLRFPPRPMCPECQSFASEWIAMSGRGRVYSWVVCHPPVLPAFQERAPYAVVLVELDEDPRLRVLGNLLDGEGDAAGVEIEIGLPVRVVFESVTEDVTLPQWCPASG